MERNIYGVPVTEHQRVDDDRAAAYCGLVPACRFAVPESKMARLLVQETQRTQLAQAGTPQAQGCSADEHSCRCV